MKNLYQLQAEEIVEGKVGYVRSEAIKRAKAWEDEKAAANSFSKQ